MHGERGGEVCCNRRRHMWSVPSPVPASPNTPGPRPVVIPSDHHASSLPIQTAPGCFLKDGRKIHVGDCALFQAGNAPPFIGIIRWFSTIKEDYLQLCVNWLYRPADVKLAKGVLESAPNEVFYSFHDDVISAASLLHPCKVAFLRKGAELPARISSFVCRRVYDIENKCLWWLTDQDYIKERQEEVDQLLDKTRLEMHAVQQGGRSPKRLNGSAGTQQLKSGSDSVQNSAPSLPLQGKGKKRDRGEQGTEPIKRERSKIEDADYASFRPDIMIKAELARMSEKGGLLTLEEVEKLVNLIQHDGAERKIDLAGRVLLANVIAVTDKQECLGKFVQLRGVPVLDEWLQEVHKGKPGDSSSPRESDKALVDLVLALLRALDKLPINLNALQTCNIGKSVNHLRSHKNFEVQKKARSLVDTWKKRVDLEIKTNEAKSAGSGQPVSWPGKSSLSEAHHAVNRRGGSIEMSMKSSIMLPSACRTLPVKAGHIDVVKSTPVLPGSLKLPSSMPMSTAVVSKDSLVKAAVSSEIPEMPPSTVKETSSSSSQSQNNSQSCSSDHAKTTSSSWKEDARSSTAGSVNASKSSGGSSRHRRSSSGYLGTSISGIQKEANFSKSGSLNRTVTLDKVSQGGLTSERSLDMPVQDPGSSHKFILRLPNLGRNLAQNGSGDSFEDLSLVRKRAPSPGTADKLGNSEHRIKVKCESSRSHNAMNMNTESWQTNDVKESLVGSDEGDQSQIAILDEGHRGSNDSEKAADVSRPASSPSDNEKGAVLAESEARNSFSSMHALIESYVDYCEGSVPIAAGDDLGMNLLATVAAGEMSIESPGRSPAMEDICAGNKESKSRLSGDDVTAPNLVRSAEDTDVCEKDAKIGGSVFARDEFHAVGTDASVDNRIVNRAQEINFPTEQNGQHSSSSKNIEDGGESCIESEVKLEGADRSDTACTLSDMKEEFDHGGSIQDEDKKTGGQDSSNDYKNNTKCMAIDENKSLGSSHEKTTQENMYTSDFIRKFSVDESHNATGPSGQKFEKFVAEPASCSPADTDMQNSTTAVEAQPPFVDKHTENIREVSNDASGLAGTDQAESADSKARNSDNLPICQLEQYDSERKEPATLVASNVNGGPGSALTSGENVIGESEVLDEHPAGSVNHESSHILVTQDTKCSNSSTSKLLGTDTNRDELASSAETSKVIITSEPEMASKLDFDLNEGIPGDDGNQNELAPSAALVDGNQNELAPSAALVCSSSIHLSFASSPNVNASSATVTVAAPAKGPFIPPENLLKSKAEPGWKGSAATSAFRPAEPRRVLEIQLITGVPLSDTGSGKHGRTPLDIDLNIADDRVLEDMASQSSAQTTGSESGFISNRDASVRSAGGLDLDLNKVDEGTDNGQLLTSTSRRFDIPLLSVKQTSTGFHGVEANLLRDFDLNNGPGIDEVGIESLGRSQHAKSTSIPFLPPVTGFRMNNAEFGSMSSWLPPGNSYPAVAIPSFLPDRGEHPYPIVASAGAQRILGSVSGGSTFSGDIYRGPVLSSSPAMNFPPTAAFPYANFPFGSSFPVASTSFPSTYVDSSSGGGSCFPAIPSQLVGPSGLISAHYPRPYMLGLPEGSTTGAENSRQWSRPGLDLNAGPVSAEMDAKDERVSAASRQFSVSTSQAFIEEQMRIYQAAAGGLKRKEPEGSLDTERYAFKRHSWQ